MGKLSPGRSGVGVLVLLLAGCGGGGSDDTPVSGNPDPSAPVAEAPPAVEAPPAPIATAPPAPSPAEVPPPPAATPGAGPAPVPVPKVAGEVVWAALVAGISPDPRPIEPVTNYRKVYTPEGYFIHLGGDADALQSHSFTRSPWGSLMRESLVSVSITGSDGVIDTVTANNLPMTGPQLDLRNVDPALDAATATWVNGPWSVQLVVQSAESADLMRVCWNVHLPPPATVTGPPGTTPVVYTVPLKRLMCGVYSQAQSGPDLGGYIEDDYDGTKRTYRGSWQE